MIDFSLWQNGSEYVSSGMIGFLGNKLKFASIQLITNKNYVDK